VNLQNFLCDRIPLRAPPTMTTVDQHHSKFYREGYILSLYLEDGSVGLGEVSSRRCLLS
jgi:isochorismate synthase/2-succinyl-5-enolpyruvyl-6-hydroxy-3-cyclohexene-1-carboxylate synthase/2-succinyl-6-hydroxy-2,4-cyclohexadiene-1-carboxylate synthase/O-succinylbenzoate synthase